MENTVRVNTETGDTHNAVEKTISLPVGGETYSFSLIIPKYVAGKLDNDSWVQIGRELRQESGTIVARMALSGEYFGAFGPRIARERVVMAAKEIVYRRFQQIQINAGEECWTVPSLLCGERYGKC